MKYKVPISNYMDYQGDYLVTHEPLARDYSALS